METVKQKENAILHNATGKSASSLNLRASLSQAFVTMTHAAPDQKRDLETLVHPMAITVAHLDFLLIIICGDLCCCEKYLSFKVPPASI